MRLFGYYALHSVFNQLRKLFKTWVLVLILVCALIGGLIGFGAATLNQAVNENSENEEVIEEIIVEDEPDNAAVIAEKLGVSGIEFFELVASGLILAVYVYMVFSADSNGARIFLPADVNLLFASPLKPQSVLMFRLGTQLGMALVGSLYLLFQIPNLMINLGVSFGAALSVIFSYCLLLITSKLIQLLTYVLSYRYPFVKKNLHNVLYAAGALLIGSCWLYMMMNKGGMLQTAVSFVNSAWTRWIPFYGWLKGFAVCMLDHQPLMAAVYLALLGAGCAAMVWFIWHMDVDFYEDAMVKSQEVAELMEAASNEKGGLTIIKRKKDRSEKIRRDSFTYGHGANVYFFKTLYNRFRFGHLGYFTKTSETYLAAGLLMAALLRFVIGTDSVIPLCLMFGVLVFFRSLGNPLNEDTKTDTFRLLPEKTMAKLFYSLAGGSVNCLLDLLPAMLCGSLLLGVNPLKVFAWLPLIISVDFYATSVQTFLELSIPRSIGSTFRQTILILFIYFGLLPDIAIMAVGIALGHTAAGSTVCMIVNLYLGLLFTGLSAVFVEPYGGRQIETDGTETADGKAVKKTFSKIGLSGVIILGATTVLQLGLVKLLGGSLETVAASPWGIWLITFLPMYLIAVPLGLLYLKRVPSYQLPQKSLSLKQFALTAVICVFLMYAGNLIGILLTTLLSRFVTSSQVVNPLVNLTSQGTILQRLLFMVILAPLIEEYIFRKQLIDRMHIYGGRTAVLLSGVMFGLFHGNFSQFFYAAALGIVFGYVYLKTGRLRYTVILHMLINFTGGILGPQIVENASGILAHLDQLFILSPAKLLSMPAVVILAIYVVLLMGLTLAGFVLLVQQMREVSFAKESRQLPRRSMFRLTCLNPGMLLFLITCAGLIVYSII